MGRVPLWICYCATEGGQAFLRADSSPSTSLFLVSYLYKNSPHSCTMHLFFILFSVVLQSKWRIGRLVLTFLDNTMRRTQPVGLLGTSDQSITEAATCTTHNKHNRLTSILSAEFETVIPAIERPQI